MADPATYRPAPGSVPDAPGVYRFLDDRRRVIYVGKAKSLRSRLASYFADLAALHPRTQAMVQTASKVEWTVVNTEVEALQLEYTWIKEYDPRFNVKYRDDKSYPWLAVTLNEEFPRLQVMRGAKKKGVRYFGPYSHAWAIRETLDLLLRVFPARTCSKGVFKRAGQIGRPCLLGYIGKCSAPCVGRVSEEEHRRIVEDFCDFMSGHAAPYLKRVERQMKEAASQLEFERAAKLRDDLKALERALEKNTVVLPDGTDADVIALSEDQLEVAVQVFHVRGGRIRGQRGWVADKTDDAGTGELVERLLTQLYGAESGEAVPREVLVPALPTESAALADWLAERRAARVDLRVPQRGDKRALLETVARNAHQALGLHKTKRASDLTTRSRALQEIQEALGLDEAPLRIECYDVSNLQGSNVVASMVVFEDGLPRKSDYRRFTVKARGKAMSGALMDEEGPRGSSDVAAIHEVITRRFQRYLDERSETGEIADGPEADSAEADEPHGEAGAEQPAAAATAGATAPAGVPAGIDPETGRQRRFAYAPGLLVVDGGPPQVAATQRALDELGIDDIPVAGLAKRLEEVWLPGQEDPVIMPRTSEGLYLLQRVRDEAHRFAITFHRQKRSKSMVESILDDVPGLGETRRKALLRKFGSLKRLRAASVEEVAEVPGIGTRTAEAVVAALHKPGAARPAINTATGEILDDDTAIEGDSAPSGAPATDDDTATESSPEDPTPDPPSAEMENAGIMPSLEHTRGVSHGNAST
ncbi:excinuclease ABC subunit UvrC [Actinopolymorpha alba]|uniref:excinuclease ABC subunit UvrC n=1 Tax=Actinopolymorpha alba TaxID=533267 RepID=UPI00036B9602|nr:excinuclease ABC subunit UvrC [Actinopolymorpha alba]